MDSCVLMWPIIDFCSQLLSFSSMLLETSFDVHTEGRRARPKRLLALLLRLDVSLQSVAQECTAASLSLLEKELNNIIHSDTVFYLIDWQIPCRRAGERHNAGQIFRGSWDQGQAGGTNAKRRGTHAVTG